MLITEARLHEMTRVRQRGVTLVELMVALVIGLLAALVIQQVLALFEGQKRTTGSGSDAQVNGALALFTLDREIRQAGYGYLSGNNSLCPLGINIYYNGETISNGGMLVPLRIIDGGDGGPDAIELVRSDADFAAIPTTIVKNMPTPSAEITADNGGGLVQNQVFIVAGKDGSKVCTLMQMSQDPQKTGNGWNLQHNSGQFPYNPPNPEMVFTDAPRYTIGDVVVNMGSFMYRRYQIACDRLVEVNPVLVQAPYTCANTTPLVEQIIDLQAQYGIAPGGSTQITEWRNATGAWANPSLGDLLRVKAVRIAVVARSVQYEKELVSPPQLALWTDVAAGDDAAPVLNLTEEQRHYRYKVYTTIVPARNLIWGTT